MTDTRCRRLLYLEASLHWNIATADRNITNSFKGFAREFFKFAKENSN
jgi:hypothetical protein